MGERWRQSRRNEFKEINEVPLSDKELKTISRANCWTCLFCKQSCPFFELGGKRIIDTPFGKIRAFKYMEKWGLKPNKKLQEATYQCTTCGRCVVLCSMGIDVPKMIEGLRSDLHTKYKMPLLEDHEKIVKSIQKNGNPYSEPREKREDWLEKPVTGKEYLYFVGCTAAYKSSNIAKSTVQLLQKSGIKLSTMKEETCCGAPLLQLGLFDEAKKLAVENAENMRKSGIRKIVTSCAHCYRTLKMDYPEMGLKFDFEVYHISEILSDLIKNGRLKLRNPGKKKTTVTYHDPCYLGRRSGIYTIPRDIIGSIPDVDFVEMAHNKEDGLCCGAGGGLFWTFKEKTLAMSQARIKEARDTKAQYLVSACPFCKLQLSESAGKKPTVLDLTEFIAKSL